MRIRGEIAIRRSDLALLAATIRELRPDLLCIVGFPWIVPDTILEIPRVGAVNVHPALLPRHRGPLPLFWTYHSDDRQTGVTIHRAIAKPDAGDIFAQRRFELERGLPVERLARRLEEEGARLLCRVADDIAGGSLIANPQNEGMATFAPRPAKGQKMIDFATWPAERVWHFLHGLVPFYVEPIGVKYRAVGGYRTEILGEPGTTARARNGWMLHCLDGSVELLR
jgi:methionyl-tRNA formyltransferase